MAIDYTGLDLSFVAAEDLTGQQFMFVTQLGMSDSTVGLMNNATDPPIGILQNAPDTGEVAVVRVTGTSKLVMNGAIAVGVLVKAEYVGTSDSGKGDPADTEADLIIGLSIVASGAENDVGAIIMTGPSKMSFDVS